MWIYREIQSYLERLALEWPVILLTGPRQSGKTSILRHLFNSAHYVSLDLPSAAEQAEHDSKLFLSNNPTPLIIDEVQYAPGLFRYLKLAVDQNRKQKGIFILTGSQRFALMKEIQESLAGRVAIVELETLSFKEVQSKRAEYELIDYILSGGYPELHLDSAPDLETFFRSYVTTYLERDLKVILDVTDLRDFERFLRACATRSANLLNKSDLARDVGISPSTASAWINALATSGIITLLEPWFSNISRTLAKSPKLYLSDVGLLCYLLNIKERATLLDSASVGAIWETTIFSEIRKRQIAKTGGWRAFFYRDRSVEVDFMIPIMDRFDIIEAKWKELPTKNDCQSILKLHSVLGEKQINKSFIACRTPNKYPIAKNIYAGSLPDIFES